MIFYFCGPDNSSGGCSPSTTKSSQDIGLRTPQPKKLVPTGRSPSSRSSFGTTAKSEIPSRSNDRKSMGKLESRKISDWKVEIAVPQSPSSEMTHAGCISESETRHLEVGDMGNKMNAKPETKTALFSNIHNEKISKFGGWKSGSRVVPYPEDEGKNSIVSNCTEEVYDDPKDAEELNRIHEQLLQIENQQSNLYDLLQVW